MRRPSDLNGGYAERVAELEKRIDHAIDMAGLVSESRVTVQVGGYQYPPTVVDSVIAMYRATGWKIDRISDPRDGDYLQLEAGYE